MNIKLSPDKKIIGAVLIFATATVAVTAGIMWPTTQSILKLNHETTTLKNYLEQKYETARHLRFTADQLETVKNNVGEYRNYLFYQGDELKLITDLETIASRHGVTQKISAPDLGKNNTNKIIFNILASGGYENLWAYLSDLEKTHYFLNVEKLHLEPVPIKGSAMNTAEKSYNLQLTLGLYVAQK